MNAMCCGLFGLSAENVKPPAKDKAVTVASKDLTAKDILDLVESTMGAASKTYRDYVFQDLMSKKQKQEPIVVPQKFAEQKGLTLGTQVAIGAGVMLLGGLILFLMLSKKKAPSFPAAAPMIIDVEPMKMLPAPQ